MSRDQTVDNCERNRRIRGCAIDDLAIFSQCFSRVLAL